jgi:hypothetical protein
MVSLEEGLLGFFMEAGKSGYLLHHDVYAFISLDGF